MVIAWLHDPLMRQAWLTQMSATSIPVFVSREIFDSWRDYVWCVSAFGVKWYQIPLVLLCSVVVHMMEVSGCGRRFEGKAIMGTQYR